MTARRRRRPRCRTPRRPNGPSPSPTGQARNVLDLAAGLDADQIASARKANAADLKSAAILASAVTVDDGRGTVTDQDLAAARTTGSTDEEIAEITRHVALNMPANYLNKAARMDIDIPVVPG